MSSVWSRLWDRSLRNKWLWSGQELWASRGHTWFSPGASQHPKLWFLTPQAPHSLKPQESFSHERHEKKSGKTEVEELRITEFFKHLGPVLRTTQQGHRE